MPAVCSSVAVVVDDVGCGPDRAVLIVAGDELRGVVDRFAVVMSPGQVLVLRLPWGVSPRVVREYQDGLGAYARHLGVDVLIVAGDGMSVIDPPVDPFPDVDL